MGMVRTIAVLGLLSLIAYLMASWNGGPQSPALSDASTSLSTNPFDSLPPWPTFYSPQPPANGTSCQGWDLGCYALAGSNSVAFATAYIGASITYLASLLFTLALMLVAFLTWFFGAITSVADVTWSLFTAPIALFPANLRIIGIALFLPLYASVALGFFRLVRGNPS